MKYICQKLVLFTFFVPFYCFSQITINSSNLPNINDTVVTAYDFANYSAGTAGANQFWNFSNATGFPDMVLGFIDPNTTPYSATFPTSNICVELDVATYYYLNRSINGLSAVGYVDSGMIYPYNKLLLPTPLNYLDTINSTQIIYQWDTLINPPLPSSLIGLPGPYMVDSIKAVYGNNDRFIVDGWGQAQVPNGTFDALRIFQETYEFDNTFYKMTDTTTGLSQWVQDPGGGIYWMESRYLWRTNDSTITWNLVEMEADSLGNPYGDISYYLGNSITSISISPPIVDLDKLEDVSCNGAADGFIILEITGTAFPFTFSWTGPNGFTSNSQDVYNLSAGMYQVTVTDVNGNSSTETYYVNEPPLLSALITQSGIDLSASVNGGIPPYTFLWNTGENTQVITPSSNGMYSCDVIDDNGCITTASFNVVNIPSNLFEINDSKILIKIVDILGRERKGENKEPLFYIYDDGTVEKRMIIR
tara:strand:+ start:382 stop:1809 length:1428 start_codon:yes stop_codon:yes gene_type:complete